MKNNYLLTFCVSLSLIGVSVLLTDLSATGVEEKQAEPAKVQASVAPEAPSDKKRKEGESTDRTTSQTKVTEIDSTPFPLANGEGKGVSKPDNNASPLPLILGGVSGLFHLLEIAGMIWAYTKFIRIRKNDLVQINDFANRLNASEQNQKKQKDKLIIQEQQLERVASETANARNLTSRINAIEQANQQKYGDDSFGCYSNFPSPETVNASVTPSQYPFLETYRQSFDSFKNQYAPKNVSEDADNLQKRWSGNQQEIILVEDRSGNYWLFNEGSAIYLLPSPKLKVNDMNVRTAGGLFDCNNYTPGYQSMIIIHPAIISAQAGVSERWKLDKKGIIEFI